MYPNSDAPYYLAGFSATLALLALSIFSYLTLPLCLCYEASKRKKTTGHALPLQSLEDSENSQVSAAAMARIHQLNQVESDAAVAAKYGHEGFEDIDSLPLDSEQIEISAKGDHQV